MKSAMSHRSLPNPWDLAPGLVLNSVRPAVSLGCVVPPPLSPSVVLYPMRPEVNLVLYSTPWDLSWASVLYSIPWDLPWAPVSYSTPWDLSWAPVWSGRSKGGGRSVKAISVLVCAPYWSGWLNRTPVYKQIQENRYFSPRIL